MLLWRLPRSPGRNSVHVQDDQNVVFKKMLNLSSQKVDTVAGFESCFFFFAIADRLLLSIRFSIELLNWRRNTQSGTGSKVSLIVVSRCTAGRYRVQFQSKHWDYRRAKRWNHKAKVIACDQRWRGSSARRCGFLRTRQKPGPLSTASDLLVHVVLQAMDGAARGAAALCACKAAFNLLSLPSLAASHNVVGFCCCCLLLFTDLLVAGECQDCWWWRWWWRFSETVFLTDRGVVFRAGTVPTTSSFWGFVNALEQWNMEQYLVVRTVIL